MPQRPHRPPTRFWVEIEDGGLCSYHHWDEAVTDLVDLIALPSRAVEMTETGPKDVTRDLYDAVMAAIPDEFAA